MERHPARRLPIMITLVLISLLTLSSQLSKATESSSKPTRDDLAKQLKDSTVLLERVNRILKQEKQRWKSIHTNPIPDEVTASYDENSGKTTINVKINTRVENEINSQPITRTYTLTVPRSRHTLLQKPAIVVVGASYIECGGFRPLVGIGVLAPKDIGKYIPYIDKVSIFAFTTLYTAGVGLGYIISKDLALSIDALSAASIANGSTYVGIGLTFHL